MKDSRRKDFRRIPGGRIFERFQEGGLFKADSRREDSQRIIEGRMSQKVHLCSVQGQLASRVSETRGASVRYTAKEFQPQWSRLQ